MIEQGGSVTRQHPGAERNRCQRRDGEQRSDPERVGLHGHRGASILQWLHSPARAFPVELDPDFYAYGTSATIKRNNATTNYCGTGTTICAGWDNTGASSPDAWDS